MNGIVWLASYPKSGNTWFRTFLSNLLADGERPVNINELDGGPIASAREPFDEALGYESGELTQEEVDALRPEFYVYQARTATEPIHCKIHDAYTYLPDGRPLIPPEATKAVLYFVRNPLDVCVSFAHHAGKDEVDWAVRKMANPDSSFCKATKTQPLQLRQKLTSWSEHVRSWIEAPGLRLHLVRYEDMLLEPEATFRAAAQFAELPDAPERIRKAIQFSSFDELRQQEVKEGFREKMPVSKSFFRSGRMGSWRETLSPDLAQQIVADHTPMMRRVGYAGAQYGLPEMDQHVA